MAPFDAMVALVASVASAFVFQFPVPVAASTLRGYQAQQSHGPDLLDELERALGAGRRAAAESRVMEFEDAMRPIFVSLPHMDGGRLTPSGARYLLHRVFVERHGWFVEGLMSRGESWNSSSPTAFFAEHVDDEETVGIFERRLGEKGLTLHETAVFAATLESLVHEETLERLHASHRVLGLELREQHASEKEVEHVIDAYMLMLVLGVDHETFSTDLFDRATASIEKIYPTWRETAKWVREVRKEVVSADPEARTDFSTTTKVLEEVADRYGRWQDSECVALKEDLMKYEKGDTGRVPLKDFYGAALNGSYQYMESKEYLKELGALDETTPAQPSVIIANYINGPSNCLASSRFYSVCCISECEALLKPIERHIGAPDATPSRIIELVEKLPSATVDAPRKLPVSLTQRLDEIAAHHGGRVPLHGRLFAQFMHHAFPRECPFPHTPGSAKLISGEEYEEVYGGSHVLNVTDLQMEVDFYSQAEWSAASAAVGSATAAAAAPTKAAEEAELPWIHEEELFVHLPTAKAPGRSSSASSSLLRGAAMLVAAGSLSVVTIRAAFAGKVAATGRGVFSYGKESKYMV